jgi:hypothetical protein
MDLTFSRGDAGTAFFRRNPLMKCGLAASGSRDQKSRASEITPRACLSCTNNEGCVEGAARLAKNEGVAPLLSIFCGVTCRSFAPRVESRVVAVVEDVAGRFR